MLLAANIVLNSLPIIALILLIIGFVKKAINYVISALWLGLITMIIIINIVVESC